MQLFEDVMICFLRRAPSNNNVDFIPVTRKADSFIPIGIAIGDKAFDDKSLFQEDVSSEVKS